MLHHWKVCESDSGESIFQSESEVVTFALSISFSSFVIDLLHTVLSLRDLPFGPQCVISRRARGCVLGVFFLTHFCKNLHFGIDVSSSLFFC